MKFLVLHYFSIMNIKKGECSRKGSLFITWHVQNVPASTMALVLAEGLTNLPNKVRCIFLLRKKEFIS